VDLDVVVRRNLLDFLKDETKPNPDIPNHRPASIVYATHIFDGISSVAKVSIYSCIDSCF
jgi:ABC-type uncharacterized transport system ATPase subunit